MNGLYVIPSIAIYELYWFFVAEGLGQGEYTRKMLRSWEIDVCKN